MKSKTTGIWFLIAALLFAFIWFSQKYLQPAAPRVENLLGGLRPADITALEINPAGAREISVVRTNDTWQLQKPLVYPAQTAAVQALITALEKLPVVTRLAANEVQGSKSAAGFGFDNPQFTLAIEIGDSRQQLIIGNKTPPGDQVYVRRVGEPGAFVVGADWLNLLPHAPNDWRDTSLVDAAGTCDWMVITNNPKSLVMEFRRDPTNQLWRMVRPLQARADSARLDTAIQQLRDGRVTQFVTDDPRADLTSYGLKPADLDVWLGRGTNFATAVHIGRTLPTNNPAQVYVQREGWNTVLAAASDTFAPWRGQVNDYRDTHLLSPLPPISEIEVHGEKDFTLQQTVSNTWAVAGEKFPADREKIQGFLKLLAGLRISEVVKDVVTAPDLQSFGLEKPAREIILRGNNGSTNNVLCDLMFGLADTNQVYVKRGDEDYVYAIPVSELAQLPEQSWEFRERHIWHFSPTNVVQITMQQNGKTRQLVRAADGKWAFAAGSQGIVSPKDIEETVQRLGDLTVAGWVAHHITAPEKYGLNPGNLSLTIELKSGEKLNLDFGAELQRSQTALAAVTLDGERWVFVMDPTLYQFVATFLTIPPNAP
jgi:hypothetical protein